MTVPMESIFLPSGIHRNDAADMFRCIRCDMKNTEQSIIDHIVQEHVPRGQAPWTCSLCDFQANTVGRLRRHVNENKHIEAEKKCPGRPAYGERSVKPYIIKLGVDYIIGAAVTSLPPDLNMYGGNYAFEKRKRKRPPESLSFDGRNLVETDEKNNHLSRMISKDYKRLRRPPLIDRNIQEMENESTGTFCPRSYRPERINARRTSTDDDRWNMDKQTDETNQGNMSAGAKAGCVPKLEPLEARTEGKCSTTQQHQSSGGTTPQNPTKGGTTTEKQLSWGKNSESLSNASSTTRNKGIGCSSPNNGGSTTQKPVISSTTPHCPRNTEVTTPEKQIAMKTSESHCNGNVTPRRQSNVGSGPRRPNNGGTSPQRPNNGGTCPKRPNNGGMSPKRPNNGGTSPQRPNNGDSTPRKQNNEGTSPHRQRQTSGQGLRSPRTAQEEDTVLAREPPEDTAISEDPSTMILENKMTQLISSLEPLKNIAKALIALDKHMRNLMPIVQVLSETT